MKKFITFCFSLLLLGTFLSGTSFARSSVAEYKNPNFNLVTLDEILVAPIIYGPEVKIDDFDRLRVDAAFQGGLHGLPVSFIFPGDNNNSISPAKVQAKLLIYVKKFTWDNYRTTGHYESYTTTSGALISGGGYWDSWGDRWGGWNRSGWGGGWGYQPVVESRTYYVEPEERFRARAEVQLTLQSLDGKITYWIYNQERYDTVKSSPDQSLKVIVEEAQKAFEKTYNKDVKALGKTK